MTLLDYQISVIIPTLNSASSLEKTLLSVLRQQDANVQVIIIDGGSQDDTLKIIQQYKQHIAHWESSQDNGISEALNKGIKQSTGHIISILNSDDCWEENTLRFIRSSVAKSPSTGIFCGKVRFIDPVTQQTYIRSPNLRNIKKRMSVFHPSLFITKSSYELVGQYSEEFYLAMDSEWIHRALKANIKFCMLNEVLANMSLGGLSDKHYFASLNEYRKSVIQHNIGTKSEAHFYFYQHLLVKLLLSHRLIRQIKQKLF